MLYPLNEIFYSLQGEATFAGTPAVFLRLQGCKVGCAFCDTKHTWSVETNNIVNITEIINKKIDNPSFANFNLAQILTEIRKYDKCRHIVLTGGEPAMYEILPLIIELEQRGYTVQIETSGTEKLLVSDKTWVTLSPKIDMPGQQTLNEESVYRANEIKMPIGKILDVVKLQNFLIKYNVFDKPIWLQPLSCNKKATQICVDAALDNNWRLSLQIHKFLNIR
jgi:7-carboxy-7-deazaguanine synthase